MDKKILIIFIIINIILYFSQFECTQDYAIEDYKKIIFFHEILEQVEQPLKYEIWKQKGDQLQADREFYKEFNEPMLKYQQVCKTNELLPKENHFGALIKFQSKEAECLFHFLYQPLDWETFVQNACWARQHVNAHMFVYTFTIAAIQRQLDHAMLLPRIYEILPRYFLNKDFVKSAQDFEGGGDLLKLQTLNDINKTNLKVDDNDVNGFKVWQWWKQIEPFNQSWHSTPNETNSSSSSTNETIWWRPIDYTRDIKIMNEHAKLSYLTEDIDWNTYWYNLNLLYPSFLNGTEMFWNNDETIKRRGEFWLYCLEQLLTRYELERFSLGFEELQSFDWTFEVKDGYDPILEESNGEVFQERPNQADLSNSMDMLKLKYETRHTFEAIEESLGTGFYFQNNGNIFNITTKTQVGNLLQSNKDTVNEIYESYWYYLSHMFLSNSNDRKNDKVSPHVLLNYETMLRDPLFYMFHKRILDSFTQFRSRLPEYTKVKLQSPKLHIMSAQISKLETYFELFDMDVSNLRRRSKINSEFLYARQMRLMHKPFGINITIASEKKLTAMLRIFLVTDNKSEYTMKYLELNKILIHLEAGENNRTFKYENYFSGQYKNQKKSQFKIYLDALNATARSELWRQYDEERFCGLNARLLLPRGLPNGFPMRLFLILNELSGKHENRHIWWRLCLPLQGERSFGFPFDRNVNEENLNSSNMYWKDVKIYHKD